MTGEHLTDLELARLLIPDPPADTTAHADRCPQCRELLEQARGDAHHFEVEVLPRTLPAVRARRGGSWLAELTRPWFAVPLLACATAAVILLIIHPGRQTASYAGDPERSLRRQQQAPVVGVKGAAAVRVFVKRGTLVWQLADRGEANPGDALRFVVEPAGARQVLIVSRDGAGAHTVYHPFGSDRSAPLPRGNAIELDGSVVLDGVLGDEELYVFLTDKPIDRAKALDSLRPRTSGLQAGPVPLVFHFTKKPPVPPAPETPTPP